MLTIMAKMLSVMKGNKAEMPALDIQLFPIFFLFYLSI